MEDSLKPIVGVSLNLTHYPNFKDPVNILKVTKNSYKKSNADV